MLAKSKIRISAFMDFEEGPLDSEEDGTNGA
jgi:hypothetical protein